MNRRCTGHNGTGLAVAERMTFGLEHPNRLGKVPGRKAAGPRHPSEAGPTQVTRRDYVT